MWKTTVPTNMHPQNNWDLMFYLYTMWNMNSYKGKFRNISRGVITK